MTTRTITAEVRGPQEEEQQQQKHIYSLNYKETYPKKTTQNQSNPLSQKKKICKHFWHFVLEHTLGIL